MITWIVGDFNPSSFVTSFMKPAASEGLDGYLAPSGCPCLRIPAIRGHRHVKSTDCEYVRHLREAKRQGSVAMALHAGETVGESLYKRLAGYKEKSERRKISPKFVHYVRRAMDLSDEKTLASVEDSVRDDKERKAGSSGHGQGSIVRLEQLGANYADLNTRIAKLWP